MSKPKVWSLDTLRCLKSELTKVWISDKFTFQELGFQTFTVLVSYIDLGPAAMIHFSIAFPYLNENDKVLVIYCRLKLHQYGNHLEVDFLEQEQLGFEPRNSEFETDCTTIEPFLRHQYHQLLKLNC